METLHLSLPSPGVALANEHWFSDFIMDHDANHPFSPGEINRHLRFVSKTLEQSSIVTMRHGDHNYDSVSVHPSVHDNSYLDLSSFEKLYSLTLSSYLLFGEHYSAAEEHTIEGRKIWQLFASPHREPTHIL